MKIGDTVSIRVGRARRVVFGKLVECVGGAAVVRIPSGRSFLRAVKYVKPEVAGKVDLQRQILRDRRRSGAPS